MEEVERVFQDMEKVSGFSKEQILCKSRIPPIPALRWFIGERLIELGWSNNKTANILKINHSTLFHGLKQIPIMPKDKRWHGEYEIYKEFRALCK